MQDSRTMITLGCSPAFKELVILIAEKEDTSISSLVKTAVSEYIHRHHYLTVRDVRVGKRDVTLKTLSQDYADVSASLRMANEKIRDKNREITRLKEKCGEIRPRSVSWNVGQSTPM